MGKLDIGTTILERRKALGLTQKQLAEKLNVTDKAVSKWERGQGYPDITMLNDLAASLQMTISELMQGTKESGGVDAPADDKTALDNTLEYADKLITKKRGSWVGITRIIVSLGCLVAIFVCMIVDLAISQRLTWAWVATAAVITGWMVTMPLLPFTRARLLVATVALSVTVPVLLLVIRWYLGDAAGRFWEISLPIMIMGIVGAWLLMLLFAYTRIQLLYKISATFVLGAVLGVFINGSVARTVGLAFPTADTYITLISLLFVAIILAGLGYVLQRRKSHAAG